VIHLLAMRWSIFSILLLLVGFAFFAGFFLFLEYEWQSLSYSPQDCANNTFDIEIDFPKKSDIIADKGTLKAKEVFESRREFFTPNDIWASSGDSPKWFEGEDAQERWTVLIGTFSTGGQRLAALLWQLKLFTKSIDAIHLNWDRADEIAQSNFKDFFQHQLKIKNFTIPVFIFAFEGASINNRWRSLAYARTELIFSIDDDIFLKPQNVWMSFQWAQKYPHRIVGGGLPMDVVKHDGYDSHFPSVRKDTTMMLNQGFGSFLSKDVLSLYFSLDANITIAREHVKEQRNCEDILINYIILWFGERDHRWTPGWSTNVYVFPKNTHLYKKWQPRQKKQYHQQNSGLSSQGDHMGTRRRCIRLFEKLWNYPEFPITNDTVSFSPECRRIWNPKGREAACEKTGKQENMDRIGNSFDEFCSWFQDPGPCRPWNITDASNDDKPSSD